ncbi:MAG: glycosyltransferase, partial [Bryobacteraceae bacterium]
MSEIGAKPKLAFFQNRYDQDLPAFLRIHHGEHVKCLSHFFAVTVMNGNCDYREVCDKYQPDLALFESGVANPACHRPTITNVRSHPQIPKLGFLHADAFGSARAGFLSDMEQWGIETFIAIATTTAEHTPAIVKNVIIWPNFVDPEIYHDYCQWKSIPVLFTGNKNSLYPWRQQILRAVSPHYPTLICPHPGYSSQNTITQVAVGESYARLLNASWLAPACGTIAREVVRKHFEVPACKACLITEKSSGLMAAGFADMENCVFADERNILDKLQFLFKNPANLEKIIENGYELVHSRHTYKQRDQVYQWFNLQKTLKTGQRIVQPNPFEPLCVVDDSQIGVKRQYRAFDGLHLDLLRQGYEALWQADYDAAQTFFFRCLSYIPYMPEPKIGLAAASLYKGDASQALSWISEPIQFTLAEYKAVDPDPVEWAYFIRTLLCLGKV